MRYFLDTEFMERPGSLELLSLAIVCEDGREFYAEASDADHSHANDWVRQNVIPQLWGNDPERWAKWADSQGSPKKLWCPGGYLPTSEIGRAVRNFALHDHPEFWGYYADYDWVVFCWLFGAMVDLPKGWPMYCRDLKQWSDQLEAPKFQAPKGEHHALADARWNRDLYHHLLNFHMGQI